MSPSTTAVATQAAMSERETLLETAELPESTAVPFRSGRLRHRSAFEHLAHALDALLERRHAGRERSAEVVRRTEARTRDHRDAGVVDEHLGERVVVLDAERRHRGTAIRPRVERAGA